MYKYHCLNPIADIGLNNFTEDYTKIYKENTEIKK